MHLFLVAMHLFLVAMPLLLVAASCSYLFFAFLSKCFLASWTCTGLGVAPASQRMTLDTFHWTSWLEFN